MRRTSWQEISAKHRVDPARNAKIAQVTRAMIAISDLTKIRESDDLTLLDSPGSVDVSQARPNRTGKHTDPFLSTLDEYVRQMGGELHLTVVFPDQTIELVGLVD